MSGSLRVASFNIRTSLGLDGTDHWLLRRRACIEVLRSLDADVVGLQEVRPAQLRQLRAAFPDHTFRGRGREASGRGEHAAVMVSREWTVESDETRWLSPTPDVAGSRGWGADHARVVTLVRVRRGDVRVGVANTHLDHARASARLHGARLIADWVRERDDVPWVLTGDLNVPPDGEPVRVLRDAGLIDTLPPDAGGTEHAFTGAADRERIDFVLAGPGVRVLGARIDRTRPSGRLPSDHWPVVADLAIG